ncbi:MAG TPA: choice-of-anchor tandem repeat GloVer-containing protein [Candidatus Cybelea sp.]
MYTFTPGDDGASYPSAALVNVKGVLYGTTEADGNGSGCNQNGCGVIFSVTTTGQEKALHVFNGGSDGASPSSTSTMIDMDGVLYGTTPNGGSSNCPTSGSQHLGCGTVFALTP